MSQQEQDRFDRECALLAKVRGLLLASELSHLEIYRQTGLKPTWLKMVANGETAAPSVNRVVYLYEFLTNTTLTVE